MSVSIAISGEEHRAARAHLRGNIEQVAFFLADFDPDTRCLQVRDWRAIPPSGFEYQSAFHVTLTDATRADIIKWAWDADACLVEAHSHGDRGLAAFSPSDFSGLAEWVPHVRWRLRGRPYGAIVTAGDTFDGLAWTATGPPEPITALHIDGQPSRNATGLSLPTRDPMRRHA